MIGAINDPALSHPEIPLLSDIVLASKSASIQNSVHCINGLVPGDGMHFAYSMLLGLNHGRYFPAGRTDYRSPSGEANI